MDRRWQVSLALVFGMFALLGAILFFAPAVERAKRTQGQNRLRKLAQDRVGQLNTEIAKLVVGSPAAKEFSKRLRDIEKAWGKGRVELRPSDEPVVQWLHVDQGQAIANAVTASDKIEDGQVVDVEMCVSSRPSILVLTSLTPTTWRIKAAPKSLKAVMLMTTTDSFEGPKDVLLCPRNCGVVTFDTLTRRHRKLFIADQFGRTVDTMVHVEQAKETVVLGPDEPVWAHGFLEEQLEVLEEEVRWRLNEEFLAKQPGFQFESLSTELNGPMRTTFVSRFSLHKEIAIVPQSSNDLHLESYVQAADGTQYGVSFRKLMKRVTPNEWSEIEIPSQLVKDQGVRSVALDEKRNRLLILDQNARLLAHQLEDETWQVLRSDLSNAIGITYWSEEDAVVVLEQTAIGAEEFNLASAYKTTLRLLNHHAIDGSLFATNCRHSVSDPHRRMTNELQVYDGFLVAVQPPAGFASFYPLRSVVRVFGMHDGQLRFEQMVPPAPDAAVHRAKGHAEFGDATKYAIFEEKLRLAKEAIAERSGSEALAFSQRLELLSDPLAWCANPRKAAAVHWIQSFGKLATPVRITDTSRPIILAISSVLAREWSVETVAGVDLRKVVFIGKAKPSFHGLPDSTELVFHNAQRQSSLRKGVAENLVGQRINTSHQCFKYGLLDSAVNIGPENGDWVLEQVLQELSQLITDARSVDDVTLPEDFRFAHIHLDSASSRHPIFSVAECTFRGPIKGSYLPNTESVAAAVRMGNGRFAVGGFDGLRQITAVDDGFDDQPLKAIPVESLRVHGMMYDDRNDRLMVQEGFTVYAFQNDQWSTLPSLPNDQAEARCFDAKEGRYHSFVRQHHTIASVYEISEAGVIVNKRVIPTPIPIDMVAAETRCFAHCTERHFILLTKLGEYPYTKTRAYVLDRETLTVQYEGPFEPYSRATTEDSRATVDP